MHLCQRLAVLEADDTSQIVIVLIHKLKELDEQIASLFRRSLAPRSEGRVRLLDCFTRFVDAELGDLTNLFAGRWVCYSEMRGDRGEEKLRELTRYSESRAAADPLAVDMSLCPP